MSYCMMIWFLNRIKGIKLEGDKVDKMILQSEIPLNKQKALVLHSNIFKKFSENSKFYISFVAPYY